MVTKVLCLLHGIHTSRHEADEWMVPLELRMRGEADYQVVRRVRYGWTSGAAIRLPGIGWVSRRRRTRMFQGIVAELREKYPAARVDVVAHSFGTWVAHYSMLRGPASRRTSLGRVVYMGSIVPQQQDWTDMPVERVLNLWSGDDRVVERAPGFGESGSVGFTFADDTRVRNHEMPLGFRHGDYTRPGPAWDEAVGFLA